MLRSRFRLMPKARAGPTQEGMEAGTKVAAMYPQWASATKNEATPALRIGLNVCWLRRDNWHFVNRRGKLHGLA